MEVKDGAYQVYVHCIQAHSLASRSEEGVPDSVMAITVDGQTKRGHRLPLRGVHH